jgi:hypothetical protein
LCTSMYEMTKSSAEAAPYPSARKEFAMDGWASAGPRPVAMIVSTVAITHPYVEIPEFGS